MELLSDGRGKLVPFGDSEKIAEAVAEILKDDSLYYSLRRHAYEYGRSRTWPKIGETYWKIFKSDLPARAAAIAIPAAEATHGIEIPEPSLDHLKRLTDDTGVFQHANFIVPDRKNGYSTDDNARALIVLTKYYSQYSEPAALRLLETYLSFVMHAQDEDGLVRNFMNFDRSWREGRLTDDALGRVLWSLGTVIAKPLSPAYLSITKECFDKSARHVEKLYPRGLAYSIFGMSDYLKQFPGASDIKRLLAISADKLAVLYKKHNETDWQWFEHRLTYDNAVLPHCLFVAGQIFNDEKYLDIAAKTCEFLLANTYNNEHFSFIGCNGWYKRGGTKACFDQQPIEAVGTIMMLNAAYNVTKNNKYLVLQRKAFDWFLGDNDLRIPLYDFRTRGCSDGLGQGGINLNQGAESILSFLLGLMTMAESCAVVSKTAEKTETAVPPVGNIPIENISGGSNIKATQIEKLTPKDA